ncbi:MAG: two-component system, LytTR family, response regulator [Mucilaginibacter sp.]|nr:two-component system, LytTR family, response regulator [Mucilaginibacter sp.]
MINCIIIDDEQYSIDTLTEYIKKAGSVNLLGSYTNPLKAIQAIKAGEKPNLVFLDIDMPELSGIELAGLLPSDIAIIYITAYSGYALQAFETNVYDFLLKPVSFTRFVKAVNKVLPNLQIESTPQPPAPEYIFINPGVKGKSIKLAFSDIIYIQGLKNYVIIYVIGGKHITYLTMNEMESALPPDKFIRIHKSYIINLNKIQSIEGNTVIISEHLNLPLGGSYKDSLTSFINKYSVISKRNH